MDSFTLNKIEFDALRRILSRFCACSLGKAMALRITPSRNPAIVRRWLAQTSQMVQAVRDHGLPPFGGVTDISEALARAHPGGGASGDDFAAIASALDGAANVKSYLNALPESLELLHAMAAEVGDFTAETQAIRSIIEPDGTVGDHASQRLAGIRREIASVSQHIHDVIYGYLHQPEVAKLLQNVSVTLHGDRFVLPVKMENRGRLPGVVHRASNTGATVFVEPEACVELNNRLVDLHDDQRAEIERLLNQLALRVQVRAIEIAATLRVLAGVDVTSAKAQYAYQFEMTCPEVRENGPFQFIQARHPLLVDRAWRQEQGGLPEAKRMHVVPIDVRLGADFDLLVITGSNTGGKTVALKTVGLLAVMAQSGMHIPVQAGSAMPVFRDVFIDVGDEQSLQQSLSTFGAHIRRIRYILRQADRSCLVLLDELGAGTDPDEGGAIGQAVLDELRSIGCVGMISTHLSVLKAYAYCTDRVDNASVEFDTNTLSPTYHLRIGTPGESHAITVAQKLGLPRRITGLARKHLSEQAKQFRKAIAATSAVRRSAEQARQEATAVQIAARSDQEMYQAKLADLHRVKEDFETWLATLPELKAGDEVHIPSRKATGRLVRLEIHRQIALVDMGSIQIEVPLQELMPDLGQSKVREEIASIRQQILQQARQTQEAMEEASRTQQEYLRSMEMQKERARQFDNWLGAIARAKVGDEVAIACKPGKGRLLELDLPGLRAKVQTDNGELTVSIQDLFPQTGPFAAVRAAAEARQAERARGRGDQRGPRGERGRPAAAARAGAGDRAASHARRASPPPNRPIRRGSPDSKAAHDNRQAILETEPGKTVFVIPFNKRATLIRVNPEKDLATVQSGIFEMEIPLADLEPVRPPRPRPEDKPPSQEPPAEGPPAESPGPADAQTPQAPLAT
ncbi:MAG TPA: MutS2/Smr-associated SH3 domain-containing protein [Phycisphaerae bacterium]|nr:MutS2/Smr-associated SH3 domain-containing protein [Phycisphaerae bacterium]